MTAEHETSSQTQTPETDTAETAVDKHESGRPLLRDRVTTVIRLCRARWRPMLWIALTIGSVCSAAALFFFLYRPDREVDAAAVDQAVQAASAGAGALLSYSSDNLDHDFAAAKPHLTGDFLQYYNTFTQQVVAPAIRDKHLVQTAVVIRAAATQFHPDSAVVLAFVNQTVTSADKKAPLITPSAIRITLRKVNGAWLISKLDPLG